MAARPRTRRRDRTLSGQIYLTVGERDEFDLHPPTVAFSKALTTAGIGNELVVSSGNRASTAAHMAAIVKFLATKLEPAERAR